MYHVAMPHLRVIAAMLLSVLALAADAGVTYRFATRCTDALQSASAGRVWIAGDRKRVELDRNPTNPRTFDLAITTSGKTTYINVQNRTYFDEHKLPPQASVGGTSGLFHLPWQDDHIKGQPKITYRDAGAGPLVGEHATTKHEIRFHYRVEAEMHGISLQGEVDSTVSVLIAPALRRGSDATFVLTRFRQVDDELTRYLSALEGMVVGYQVSVSRKLEGGPALTETITMSIDELKTIDVDDSLFAIPPGLTYQEPLYGVPGQ